MFFIFDSKGREKTDHFLIPVRRKKTPDNSRAMNSSICGELSQHILYSYGQRKIKFDVLEGSMRSFSFFKDLDETLRGPKITHYYKGARENANFLWMGVALSCTIAIR